MAVPPNKVSDPPGSKQFRRLLTRAEAITLIGMVLCIFSLFLQWPVPLSAKLPVPALVISLTRTGAAISGVRWPVTIGAIFAGLMLAFTATPSNRLLMVAAQGIGGLICFMIPLTHFGMQPGVLVCLVGGALLTFGAVDRLTPELKADR